MARKSKIRSDVDEVSVPEGKIVRYVHVDGWDNACLRQIALELGVTSSELISAALAARLPAWSGPDGKETYARDHAECEAERARRHGTWGRHGTDAPPRAVEESQT